MPVEVVVEALGLVALVAVVMEETRCFLSPSRLEQLIRAVVAVAI
jgi:hypothetical protein